MSCDKLPPDSRNLRFCIQQEGPFAGEVVQLVPDAAGGYQSISLKERDCAVPERSMAAGRMFFANKGPGNGCRIASADITYQNSTGAIVKAVAGEIINPGGIAGESIYYPSPARQDCYFYTDACADDEFCMVNAHERWGKWASDPSGRTADANCNKEDYGFNITSARLAGATESDLQALRSSITNVYCGAFCPGGNCTDAVEGTDVEQRKMMIQFESTYNSVASTQGNPHGSVGFAVPNPWKPMQGVCVKHRTEHQSCFPTDKGSGDFYQEAYITRDAATEGAKGGSIDRPLVCGSGLRCHGTHEMPHTCMRAPGDVETMDTVAARYVDLHSRPREHSRREQWSCSEDMGLECKSGLVCTGKDFDVLPNTCVKARPADLCYAGPWWDSTKCPRTEGPAPRPSDATQAGSEERCGGGMSQEQAEEALKATMLLIAGEVAFPGTCRYWTGPSSGWHVRAQNTRKAIYDVFEALWPSIHNRMIPDFDIIEKEYYLGRSPDGNSHVTAEECAAATETSVKCEGECNIMEATSAIDFYNGCQMKNCRIRYSLAQSVSRASRPNQVWSLIHWVMHNLPERMSVEQVQASKAIALILKDNFWCNDCRGFFTIGVLGAVGYPPVERNGTRHAMYWNLGHNIANEHVASTRGGHPWLYQLANQSTGFATAADFQNPFFMPFDFSERQWKQTAPCPGEGAGADPGSRRRLLF